MKVSFMLLAALSLMGLGLLGCHVERETSPTGPGAGGSQVIKFENLTRHGVLVRIPDAHQEFELAVRETKTVEAYSEEGITVFFVQVFHSGWEDISVAPRWTGFVAVGKVVTIQHISRVQIHD